MTSAKAGWTRELSLRAAARWAGLLNVLSALPAGFAVTTMQKLFVSGNATATATRILGSEMLFRTAFVADLISVVIFIAAEILLYGVFRPAGRRLSLFFLVLVSSGAAIQSLNCLQDLAALTLLKGGATLSALPSAQAIALALLFLRLHSYSYTLALFFYGCSSLVMARLVRRSNFVPRILGLFMMIDGLGYITFSLGTFLSPPFIRHLYPFVPFGTTIGEMALFGWLIIRSVNAERWREQAIDADRAATA